MSFDNILEKTTKSLLIATLLIPPFIVAGGLYFPFISGKAYLFRLLVELSFAFWLILIIRHRKYWPNFKNPILITTLLFLGGLIITALTGIDPINSFFSNIERADGVGQFIHWVVYLVMLITVFRTRNDWQLLLKIFILLATALAIYGWAAYKPRLEGSFGNPSYLGAFMLFAIGLTAVLAATRASLNPFQNRDQTETSSKVWLVWLGLGLFFALTLIFTQTRGAYLGLGFGFLLVTLLSVFFLRSKSKRLTVSLVVISLLSLAGLFLIFTLRDSPFIKSHGILSRVADLPTIGKSAATNERLRAWKVALEAFKDKPLLGWGPENFGAAFNKHYDFQATQVESWFDRPHNQPLQTLTEGGIFLFSLYLFWIIAIFYVAFRIFRKKPLLGGIFAATYSAFLVQDLFLFDTYPLYLGLFPLLGFVYSEYEAFYPSPKLNAGPTAIAKRLHRKTPLTYVGLILVAAATSYLIFYLVWLPFQSNSLLIKFFNYLKIGRYEEAQKTFDKSTQINSPYTFFDSRKNGGWLFLEFLDKADNEGIKEPDREPFTAVYRLMTVRLEEALIVRPSDQQIYFVLGKTYRLGAEALGMPDEFKKSEVVLLKGREFSPNRAEYVNELALVLIREKRYDEAESLVKGHLMRVNPSPLLAHIILGHLYFMEGKYDLAMREYDGAKALGYQFWQNEIEYNRYVFVSDKAGDYGKILEASKEYLQNRGPDGDIWFNVALAFKKLGQDKEAALAFGEAAKLKPQYLQYQNFFR